MQQAPARAARVRSLEAVASMRREIEGANQTNPIRLVYRASERVC
jgi:hypothetical protein